jgi:hypothetical protein
MPSVPNIPAPSIPDKENKPMALNRDYLNTAKPRRGLGGAITRARQRAIADANERAAKHAESMRSFRLAEAAQRESVMRENKQNEWGMLLRRCSAMVTPGYEMLMAGEGRSGVTFHTSSKSRGPSSFPFAANNWRLDMAYYDFKFERIVTEFSYMALPDEPTGLLRPTLSDAQNMVTVLKGILQHEMGHARFTIPFPDLALTMDYMKVWNVLEDQRMECLVVEQASIVADYFTSMVTEVLLGSQDNLLWLLVAGRTYLPQSLREAAKGAFALNLLEPTAADEWEFLVDSYKAAENVNDLAAVTVAAHEFLTALLGSVPAFTGVDHHNGSTSENDERPVRDTGIQSVVRQAERINQDAKDKAAQAKADAEAEAEAEESEAGKVGTGSSPGDASYEDGQAEGQGEASDSDQQTEEKSESVGRDDTSTEVERSVKDEITDAQQKARDRTSDHDLAEAASALRENRRALRLGTERIPNVRPENDGPTTMNPSLVGEARALATGVRRALATVVTESAPTWQTRQEEGFIDALAYRTREIGQRDYRRRQVGEHGTGLDLHVSVLLDISGSMDGSSTALGVTAYALKLACDELPGVTSDFVFWSSGGVRHGLSTVSARTGGYELPYFRVWGDGLAPVPFIPPTGGGTNPIPALRDVLDDDSPQKDKAHHLVIVMTDGAIPGVNTLFSQWLDDQTTTFMVINYNQYYSYDPSNFRKETNAHYEFGVGKLEDMTGLMVKGIKSVRGRMANNGC